MQKLFKKVGLNFSEGQLDLLSKGFSDDYVNIDRVLVEWHLCPKCSRFLVYKGFNNGIEYRSYGTCAPCNYARLFWADAPEVAGAKKKFSATEIKV